MSSEADLERFLQRLGRGDSHRRELRELGERRRAALTEADEVLRRVEELTPEALYAGLSVSEIARLSAVSRPTVYEFRRRGTRR